MRRRVWTGLLVAGALLALACTDQNPLAPDLPELNFVPAPSGSCSPALARVIFSEIKQIYRARPLLELEAGVRFAIIVLQCARNPAEAQARTVKLSGFAAQKFQDHRLLSTITWSDVSEHIDDAYQYVGLTPPHIPEDAVGGGSAVAVVGPTDPPTVVTTGDDKAGVFIPTGAFSQTQTVLLTIVPDPNRANPFPNNQRFQEFGPFYNFQTFPEVPLFHESVRVGICVDLTYVPAEQAHRLQLAHPRHPDLKALEVLARVAAEFLPCDAFVHAGSGPVNLAHAGRAPLVSRLAQQALALFRPQELHAAAAVVFGGGLGGETTSFSDFRAIDPGKLVFRVQPSNTPANQPITPAVQVALERQDGSTIPAGSSDTVKVAIGSNPGEGTLSGVTKLPLESGVATFSTLRIDQPGEGYTLTATDTSSSGAVPQPATSAAFDVTRENGDGGDDSGGPY